MRKIRSFKGILEKEFYNEIFVAVEEYVEDNPNRLGCSTRYVLSADEANVSDMIIKLVHISNCFCQS